MKNFTKIKRIAALMLALALLAGLSACGKKDDKQTESKLATASFNVYCLSGPTGVGMASLMDKSDKGSTKNTYKFTVATATDQVTSQIINKEADIAAVSTNLAANLYAKTNGQIEILAVNTLGVLYVLDSTSSVTSLKDLKGKNVYMTGQGANPEYAFDYLLKENGIDPDKDLTITFVSDNQELASLMIAGTAKVCVAPQPVATAIEKKSNAKNVISLSDEWDKLDNGSSMMMGCIVAQKSVIKNNPEAIKLFLNEYKDSINAAIVDPASIAALCETYNIITPAAIAQAAIPYCGLDYITGSEMKNKLTGYLQVLYNANAASVGGAMPDDGFWYAG